MSPISSDIRSIGTALGQLTPHVAPDQQPLMGLARHNLTSLAEQVEALENLCLCPLNVACEESGPPPAPLFWLPPCLRARTAPHAPRGSAPCGTGAADHACGQKGPGHALLQ